MSEGEDEAFEEPPEDVPPAVENETKPSDPMGVIVDWIRKTEGADTSGRQKDITDTVRGRLNTKLKDYLDMKGLDVAIENLAYQVSTWVDQIALEAEKEMLEQPAVKRITKKFRGMDDILYRIELRPNNKLTVETMSYYDVVEKKSKITKPMTMSDLDKFKSWADKLTGVSEAWTNWVNNTVYEAFCMYSKLAKNRDQATTDCYLEWIEKKRKEGRDWKRAQVAISNWANRWNDWAIFTRKTLRKD